MPTTYRYGLCYGQGKVVLIDTRHWHKVSQKGVFCFVLVFWWDGMGWGEEKKGGEGGCHHHKSDFGFFFYILYNILGVVFFHSLLSR